MSDLLKFAYNVVFGSYADIASGVLGLLAAVAFAKAPIESLPARRALFQLLTLDRTVSAETYDTARHHLVVLAERLLDAERTWNTWGAYLLFASFAVLITHAFSHKFFG
jgi:hypothetical protein